jgi:hypothetical protein
VKVSNALDAGQAAFRSTPSDTATQRAWIAQLEVQPQPSPLQQTEAKTLSDTLKQTWQQPEFEFVRANHSCNTDHDGIVRELAAYDKHILEHPPDDGVRQAMEADIRKQSGVISKETLNGLASVQGSSTVEKLNNVYDKLLQVNKSVHSLTKTPTKLAVNSLSLQLSILSAAADKIEDDAGVLGRFGLGRSLIRVRKQAALTSLDLDTFRTNARRPGQE